MANHAIQTQMQFAADLACLQVMPMRCELAAAVSRCGLLYKIQSGGIETEHAAVSHRAVVRFEN